jgi:hypothetical protein
MGDTSSVVLPIKCCKNLQDKWRDNLARDNIGFCQEMDLIHRRLQRLGFGFARGQTVGARVKPVLKWQ